MNYANETKALYQNQGPGSWQEPPAKDVDPSVTGRLSDISSRLESFLERLSDTANRIHGAAPTPMNGASTGLTGGPANAPTIASRVRSIGDQVASCEYELRRLTEEL